MNEIWILLIMTNGVCMGMNGMPPSKTEFNSKDTCYEAKAKMENRCLKVECLKK